MRNPGLSAKDTCWEKKNRVHVCIGSLLMLCVVFVLFSCGNPETESGYESPAESLNPTDTQADSAGYPIVGSGDGMIPKPVGVSPVGLEDYKVMLEVNNVIKAHETGELRVWIGAEKTVLISRVGMTQDSVIIPGGLGQYAKITPYAPDFDIRPEVYQCIRIHPSGSDVRFVLTPKSSGTFRVSANIELYENSDCAGAPVPKTAASLNVVVDVDKKHTTRKKIEEMKTIAWEKIYGLLGSCHCIIICYHTFCAQTAGEKQDRI